MSDVKKRFGYGKIGRSMPLTLDKCANLGGDVEMVAVVKTLALRNPEHEFWLVGRNTGENPTDVGLPANVINPWTHPNHRWGERLLTTKRDAGLNRSNLTVQDHFALQDIYDDLTLPTLRALDGFVLWAGQHGTTNAPIPGVKDPAKLTKPHDWCAHYCAFLLRGVNAWRDVDPWNREEVWLNADPRNYLKMRDLKWPLRQPVLTQFDFDHNIKHARYGSTETVNRDWRELGVSEELFPGEHTGIWKSRVRNAYARLEVNGMVPGTPFGDLISYSEDPNRQAFGLFINEARRYVRDDVARVNVMNEWVMPLRPAWIHGTWSDESMLKIADANPWWNRDIKPAPWSDYYPRLHSVRSTFTTPSSGSRWATAKPWEAFAGGTVCFFHEAYDTQDNILGDAPEWLRKWLRVESPEQLRERVQHMHTNTSHWLSVIRAQRAHFDAAIGELHYAKLIEERLFGTEDAA